MLSIGRPRLALRSPVAMVLNCGSSSVKYQLFENDASILRGSVENIGSSNCKHSTTIGGVSSVDISPYDYPTAITAAIKRALDVRSEIACVGHRVVHGGPYLTQPTLINAETLSQIQACSQLAPLHNPSNLRGIELAQEALTGVPQVACFDTAFHCKIPPKAHRYAIPRALADKEKLRRYGFHGLSYAYVSGIVRERRMIVAHLGSGCSVAAIVDGKSIDTTMGFTPMEGLVMSTRAGSIDPGLMIHLLNQPEFSSPASLSNLLNKKSGLLGLSGQSADMKQLLDIEKRGGDGASHAHEAVEVFVYTVQKYIGQLMASLEYNVDAIVFTGGIGENSPEVRERILRSFSNYGVVVDREANHSPGPRGIISANNSRMRLFAIKTNEELQIARDSLGLITSLNV